MLIKLKDLTVEGVGDWYTLQGKLDYVSDNSMLAMEALILLKVGTFFTCRRLVDL